MISTFLALVMALMPIVQQGITVQVATCDAGYAGYYQPGLNALTVCEGQTEKQAQVTFAHELIHAVQDARDGINDATYQPLLTQAQRNELANTRRGRYVLGVLERYEQDEMTQAIEFEAWYFESLLSTVIFD